MPGTPTKGRRFGGSKQHQRLMMANLVASLIAAEGIVTTEAKAKAMRPIAEKMITKARKGGLHNHRRVLSYLGDTEVTVGYDVTYRYDGAERSIRMDQRPGDRLPVIDGQVVTQTASVEGTTLR